MKTINKNRTGNVLENWYEFRVDGKKVAAVGPISRDASTKVYKLVADTRYDLYKDRVLQIVACFANLKEDLVIHEEHPTVLEFELTY